MRTIANKNTEMSFLLQEGGVEKLNKIIENIALGKIREVAQDILNILPEIVSGEKSYLTDFFHKTKVTGDSLCLKHKLNNGESAYLVKRLSEAKETEDIIDIFGNSEFVPGKTEGQFQGWKNSDLFLAYLNTLIKQAA